MWKLAFFLSCMFVTLPCKARTITVDDDAPADFNNIQAAIDDANNGDVVIVAEGIYFQNINFKGKNIIVRSTDPTNSAIVHSTAIDGRILFRGTEDSTCALSGFNIDSSIAGFDLLIDPNGDNHTHATISHCVLENIITGCGRVIWACDGSISNCIIANTTYMCLAPWPVPAIVGCHGLINNCTIVNCRDGIEILTGGTCTIENCIIYDSPPVIVASGATLNISYCDLQGGLSGILGGGTVNWGLGNIDADPCFADPNNGDYHLKSQAGRWDPNSQTWVQDDVTSPCIDTGDISSPVGYEPFPNGGVINMGAYGSTTEASKSYFAKPLCITIVAGDINGDCEVNFEDFRLMALHWLEDNNPANQHCILEDNIKYCIQTNKSVYHSGETVEILYRVTNQASIPVNLGWVPMSPFCYHFAITDNNDAHVWQWPWAIPTSPPVEFRLDAYESKEFEINWDMINDNGTAGVGDDFPAGSGTYNITGELHTSPEEDRVRVSVSINVRE